MTEWLSVKREESYKTRWLSFSCNI